MPHKRFTLLSNNLGGRSVVGASEVCRNRFFGRRWLHWEATGGVVCLREIWLDSNLVDHAVCLKFGGRMALFIWNVVMI